jgi:DNA 3'-phosphatase
VCSPTLLCYFPPESKADASGGGASANKYAGCSKLACFDFDGCLAKTSLFKKGPEAWSLLFPSVATHLARLNSEGYRVVIFTNQSDIGKAAKPDTRAKAIAEKTGRLSAFVKTMGFPITVFVAAAKAAAPDTFRKPGTGMWDTLIAHYNNGVVADMTVQTHATRAPAPVLLLARVLICVCVRLLSGPVRSERRRRSSWATRRAVPSRRATIRTTATRIRPSLHAPV